ncbi:hypothetical protein [Streptomyces sp. NBC_00829]|uniref:hypothetical protein n=1 Tax=Streptomyces sp. NBC_00829 TaxID=2903679 RepID=UPI00386B8353|nr:hypothetical protein OG293_12975 [Streptomyces sp. NBC_00829]
MRVKTACVRTTPSTALTALVTVPVLLLATACTSSDDGKQPARSTSGAGRTQPAQGPGSGGPASVTPAPGKGASGGSGDARKPLSEPQLKRAALAGGDLPGFQISEGKSALAPSGQPAADKRVCQPLADAMGDKPSPQAGSTVNRGVGSVQSLGLAVSASVSSYSEAGAGKLMDSLTSALAKCGSGFTATLKGRSGTYREVKSAHYTVRGADGTVSWTTLAKSEGTVAPIHLVVARKGATVVRFMAFDLARKTPPRVPQEVADKQLAKVAQALRG